LDSTKWRFGMHANGNRKMSRPLHEGIASTFRARIEAGELPIGTRLPPSRALAHQLGVSRSTVVRAYGELAREGWVEARVGRGTIVRFCPDPALSRQVNWDLLVTPRIRGLDPEFDEVLRLLSQPDLVSFAGGLPDPELFPVDELSQTTRQVLEGDDRSFLQWCPPSGYLPLRRWLAERNGCRLEEVLILTGSTQGLHLLSQALIQPGDVVVVEAPTYLGAIRAFSAAGARLVTVPCEARGIDLNVLQAVLEKVRPKFLYTIPTFHNPTGGTLPASERRELVAITSRYGVPIVEDDPFSALRYDGRSLPSVRSLDTSGAVIHLSTFSKAMLPGLRVGWLIAPAELTSQLSAARGLVDLFVNGLAQASLHRFCENGIRDQHVERVRPIYRQRRDAMAAALRRYCPDIAFDVPEGGLFIWAKLPEGVVARRLLRQAIREGVAFVHGDLFFANGGGSRFVRLCFAGHAPEVIRDGIRKLSTVVARTPRGKPAHNERRLDAFVI
jgi:2-aminoadipate transaminase